MQEPNPAAFSENPGNRLLRNSKQKGLPAGSLQERKQQVDVVLWWCSAAVDVLGHVPVSAVRGQHCCGCEPHRCDLVLGQAAAGSALDGQ